MCLRGSVLCTPVVDDEKSTAPDPQGVRSTWRRPSSTCSLEPSPGSPSRSMIYPQIHEQEKNACYCQPLGLVVVTQN